MAIATLEEYLREFSVEIGDRILTSYPALHAPGDPISPILGTLLRKPFAAQEIDEIPRELHDVPLDMIVTEHGARSFASTPA